MSSRSTPVTARPQPSARNDNSTRFCRGESRKATRLSFWAGRCETCPYGVFCMEVSMPKLTWRNLRQVALDYALLTIGAALLAINIDLFLVPNKIVAGGATGIATILHIQFGLPTGVIV